MVALVGHAQRILKEHKLLNTCLIENFSGSLTPNTKRIFPRTSNKAPWLAETITVYNQTSKISFAWPNLSLWLSVKKHTTFKRQDQVEKTGRDEINPGKTILRNKCSSKQLSVTSDHDQWYPRSDRYPRR